MLVDEIRNLSSVSRDTNEGFKKQWDEMEEKIRNTAKEGKNYCTLVYGRYNEQLIEKLKQNGFKVMHKMELFPQVHYGDVNCLTQYVVW